MNRIQFMLVVLLISLGTLVIGRSHTLAAGAGDNTGVAADSETRLNGDTVEDAIVIPSLPYTASGNTSVYANNYDESCPYPAESPDVVYQLIPSNSISVTVDMFGSNYDTKVWIWDDEYNLIACNDDYYIDGVSKITSAALAEGGVYFIVVDGYPGESGSYQLHVSEYEPCEITCPGDAVLEGEPELVDGYIDELNAGCTIIDLLGYAPYQAISSPLFCAVSGWYDTPGNVGKDIDWFTLIVPESGFLEISVATELTIGVMVTNPEDCDNIWWGEQAYIPGCTEGSLTIEGAPGETAWIVVAPWLTEPPEYYDSNEFDYVVYSNVEPQVRVKSRSWSGVKSLFH